MCKLFKTDHIVKTWSNIAYPQFKQLGLLPSSNLEKKALLAFYYDGLPPLPIEGFCKQEEVWPSTFLRKIEICMQFQLPPYISVYGLLIVLNMRVFWSIMSAYAFCTIWTDQVYFKNDYILMLFLIYYWFVYSSGLFLYAIWLLL